MEFSYSEDIAKWCDGEFPVDVFHQIKIFKVFGSGRRSAVRVSFFQRFYNLEVLEFSNCVFKYGEKPAAGTIVSRIRKLKFNFCRNITNIWKKDSELGDILPNLQTLEIGWCGDDLVALGSFSSVFRNLTTLEVERCGSLINLAPPSVAHSFQNLTTLKVGWCEKMINLVTPLVGKSLVRLTTMTITDCFAMTEIVASEEDGVTNYEISFSNLKCLKLVRLKNLASFCSGNRTFRFPCLEELIVENCPSLKIFCKGVLSTPLLQKVKKERFHDDGGHRDGDLNTTIQLMYSQSQKV